MNRQELLEKVSKHSVATKSGGLFSMLGMNRILFGKEHIFTLLQNIMVISKIPENFPIEGELDFNTVFKFLNNCSADDIEISQIKEGYKFDSTRMDMMHPFFPEEKLKHVLTITAQIINGEWKETAQISDAHLESLKLLADFSGGQDTCACETKDGYLYGMFISQWAKIEAQEFPNCSLFSQYINDIYNFCKGKNIEYSINEEYLKFKDLDDETILLLRLAQKSDLLTMVEPEMNKERKADTVIEYTNGVKQALVHAQTLCDKKQGTQSVEILGDKNHLIFSYKANGTTIKEKVPVQNLGDFKKIKIKLDTMCGVQQNGVSTIETFNLYPDSICIAKASGITTISRYDG
jgi:hypothetical protein